VAAAAHVSRSTVSRIELGSVEEVAVRTIDAIFRALSARLELVVTWNAEALDRLLDADHAALVEAVARTLRVLGWDVAVEVSFNVRGERGSIDILAFHGATGMLLVVEIKSVIPDLQATLHVLDRKARLAATIARDRGWIARGTARLLVVPDNRTARRRVSMHEATFTAALPERTVAVRRWLRQPDPEHPLAGLWFLSDVRGTVARHRVSAPRGHRLA